MSAANSIHGIVLVGAMLIAATAHNTLGYVLAFIAAAFAAMNVVGGYVVTGRMLKMFRRRPVPAAAVTPAAAAPAQDAAATNGSGVMSGFQIVIQLIYVAAASCFVLGLHLMNTPATARRGNQVSVAGHGGRGRRDPRPDHPSRRDQRHRLDRDAGRRAGRRRRRAVRGAHGADDRDAAAGQLFNAVGGGAAALVAIHDYMRLADAGRRAPARSPITTVLDVIIGSVTFTGSLIAAGKLQGVITRPPVTFPGAPASSTCCWPRSRSGRRRVPDRHRRACRRWPS